MRPVFRLVFHLLARVRIAGRENVPRSGGYLIAINHVGLFEPPFILAFWPATPEAVGAVDIWERPGQALLARLYGGIKVHRGEYDRRMLVLLVAALSSGRPVLIAPEGGRSHTPGMRRGLPGIAYAVDRAGVPVVPVAITGAGDHFLRDGLHGKRPLITMQIGAPLSLPPLEVAGETASPQERHNRRQENVDRIMRRIAAMLPPEYRGVYRDAK
jgi:1-acyl-sn-glycerol-3-phosphate acyltransferase